MLLYDPPFLMIEDVLIHRDSGDPETFYWLKGIPELVSTADGPSIWGTILVPDVAAADDPDAVNRTTLSFDTEITLAPGQNERLAEAIHDRWGKKPKRLVPAPLSSGTVTLTLATTADFGPGTDVFVHSGHAPSLVADNRAAFAVAADGVEGRLLAAAMMAGSLAATVSYDLTYRGIAPSFRASMKVDWRGVYRRFRERSAENFIFVSDEVDKTITSLKEDSAITIKIEELDPDGATAATKALFDQFREEIMKKLFERPMQFGDVPVEERIAAGIRDIGSSLLPGRHHLLRTLNESALTTTTLDLSEERVRDYPFHPQSTLAGLVADVADIDSHIAFVAMGGLANRPEELRVELSPGSAELGIRFVEVDVTVTSPGASAPLLRQTAILRPDATSEVLRFRRHGLEEPSATYRLVVHLSPEQAPSGHETISFPEHAVAGNRIFIDPEAWLDIASLRIVVDDPALFSLPARLLVEIRPVVAGVVVEQARQTLELSAAASETRFAIVVDEGQQTAFHLTEIFQKQGEPDHKRVFEHVEPGEHRVMNPFGQSWQMRILGIADWQATDRLFAEFRVWDVERALFLRDQFTFSQAESEFLLAFSTGLETPRRAEVRVTRIGTDGSFARGPWRDIVGPVATVRDDISAQRRIRAILVQPDFSALDLRKAWVEIIYNDDANGIAVSRELVFTGNGSVQDLTHDFPDPTREVFRYRLRGVTFDGARYTGDWIETRLDSLRLTFPPDAFN